MILFVLMHEVHSTVSLDICYDGLPLKSYIQTMCDLASIPQTNIYIKLFCIFRVTTNNGRIDTVACRILMEQYLL